MVELNVVVQLEDVHLAQAINYKEAYGLEIGLLIYFGNKSLQFNRVRKPKKQIKKTKEIKIIIVKDDEID